MFLLQWRKQLSLTDARSHLILSIACGTNGLSLIPQTKKMNLSEVSDCAGLSQRGRGRDLDSSLSNPRRCSGIQINHLCCFLPSWQPMCDSVDVVEMFLVQR